MEGPRKRQLEADDNEEHDTFDTEDTGAPRRGRKEGRRVSGVYREIKSLQNIGGNALVMSLVFRQLNLKDLVLAASMCSMWNTTACREMRRRHGNAPLLRLWNSQKSKKYLWMEWELYFHDQLLSGSEDSEAAVDEPMENNIVTKRKPFRFPSIQTIISVGSKYSFEQFTHDDAKLPFRQDHIYFICADAIISTPDFSRTDVVQNIFSWDSMVVQSLFIPKSDNFTLKVFSLESSVETWEPDQIKQKVEFPAEDIGEGQELRAVLCVHYTTNGSTMSFTDNFIKTYNNVGLLSGAAEEIGSNRNNSSGAEMAVGVSLYARKGANVTVYEIDFQSDSSTKVLDKMEEHAKLFPNGFCFMLSHDTRNLIEVKDGQPDETEEEWYTAVPNESIIEGILVDLRKRMPKIPILGVKSWPTVTAQTVEESYSNVPVDSDSKLHYGFLLVTYE